MSIRSPNHQSDGVRSLDGSGENVRVTGSDLGNADLEREEGALRMCVCKIMHEAWGRESNNWTIPLAIVPRREQDPRDFRAWRDPGNGREIPWD